jgi:hypothetical protein
MSEEKRLTFIEKLKLKYANKVIISENGKEAVFAAENKDFGEILITGDLDDWRDEDDFSDIEEEYLEQGADWQDVTDDYAFRVYIRKSIHFPPRYCNYLFATEALEYLDEIFADNMISHCFKHFPKWKGCLYTRADFESLLAKGSIRLAKNGKICVWSGNYPYDEGQVFMYKKL